MDKLDFKEFLIDDWHVTPAEGLLSRGNVAVRLEPKAMEVLLYFAGRPNDVISREELEQNVWHNALIGYDAVTNTIIKLRKALGDDARNPRFIATIPKRGYQLIASITFPESSSISKLTTQISDDSHHESNYYSRILSLQTKQIVIFLAIAISIFSSVFLWSSTPTELISADSKNPPRTLPSIIVLPFENLNHNPKQNYLADGLTEDIITDLSRLSNLLVIASNTSLKYKGKQVTPEKVGIDLDVGYALKGTIRRLGNKIRVNAQLVNTKTGFNVWAERYDRNANELFAVQDEVTKNIVKALTIKITSREKSHLLQRSTHNLKAYDFFQEGQRLYQINTKESNAQARQMYRKAIELDPGYGRAYSAYSYTLTTDYRRGWSDTPLWTINRALELAKQSTELDNTSPQTYWALSFAHLLRKEYDDAEKAVQQAINIAPNYADGHALLALIKMYLGKPEEAIKHNNKGMRLNPYYTWNYLYTLGSANYILGKYDEAVKVLEQAQARNENAIQVKIFLAASYIKANRQNDAEWVTDELSILSPSTTLSVINKTSPIADEKFKRSLLDDLRKAGLQE